MAETPIAERIKAQARALGFEAVGIARLEPSDHAALYRAWLERGLHGEMSYLAREDAVEARLDPQTRWPELKSAVVVAHHYGRPAGSPAGGGGGARPGDEESGGAGGSDLGDGGTGGLGESGAAGGAAGSGLPGEAADSGDATDSGAATLGDASTGVIARYARGRDYHRVVKKKLMKLLWWLEEETGRELPAARAYVDTGPILERELGRRAGLGWFGRNTMLIDPRRGSWFFLGELLLPFELEYDPPFEADRCGSCRACVPACPTDALLGRNDDGAPVMDATRCISYLTIENQGPIPPRLRSRMTNRVFGCDICQEACPFVQRFAVESAEADYLPRRSREFDVRSPSARSASASPRGGRSSSRSGDAEGSRRTSEASGRAQGSVDRLPGTEGPSLVELLRTALDPDAWDAFTRGSAIRRAGRAGLARNVCVAMGNWLASVDEPPEEAVAVLRVALEDRDPLVREHAGWALESSQAPSRDDPSGRR